MLPSFSIELYEGVARSDERASERKQVLGVLDSKHVVAATALREDEPLVTRSVDHFERIPGLTARTY